jgi:hypothetical protein
VNIILCILKSIAAWAILTFLGTNLIGFVVRGILWSRPSLEAPDESVADFFPSRKLDAWVSPTVQ